jgi:hypothetical protein
MWPGVVAGVIWMFIGAWQLIAFFGRKEPA